MPGHPSLQQVLDRLYAERSPRHLAEDPLSFCHRYTAPADRELVALLAALFAYGSVRVIRGSLERVVALLGPSPSAFVDRFSLQREQKRLASFRHRFNDGTDLGLLLQVMQQMRRQAGSIEQFFARLHDPAAATVADGLNRFSAAAQELARQLAPVLPDSFRFLFPAPAGGSACKRLCMFLRWVVRPADGIDLGLWQAVRPGQLVMPVDRHIERISRLLGLTSRKSPDWRMACEITAALRRFAPDDPVRYDFPLCHLGISEGCNGSRGPACSSCPVSSWCCAARG